VLSTGPAQALLKRQVDKQPEGPDDAARSRGQAVLIGEAVNARGEKVQSRLRVPEGYTLTYMTGLEIARRVMAGEAQPGFHTPSQVFGPDFITEFEGCAREDLNS